LAFPATPSSGVEAKIPLTDYVYSENRYNILKKSNPEASKRLIETAQKDNTAKLELLKHLAEQKV
jgi:pyruvate/2-oxoacid:ferredoxin oxidoreductase beta subunit